MSWFGGSKSPDETSSPSGDMDTLGSSPEVLPSDPKSMILHQIKQEAALNNARQLVTKLNNHCFEKCVPSPGSSLSKKEEGCFTMCMEKYMATWNTVGRTYVTRITKTQMGTGGGGGIENFGAL